MYLKSLELHGFKSFPDKIKLDFNKGISAVVGPNGSGKSNIGDAMRWVMGEQSSKTLRGGKMEDVIFNGSKTRSRAGFAQVTLTIDNDDRVLGIDSELVSVSRKLYRNGDSEYMINGSNVRLKDIVELFMDTGLGRDGYSIIGQGKIADIVSSKSTERREIFEEAAGISKFRYKKEEAERKLVAAEDNISRLQDIIGELDSRIGPLEKQCEKAKKFRVFDDEKRKLEISVWTHKLNEYLKSLQGYQEKLTSLDEQYTVLTDDLDKLEDSIEDSFAMSAEKSALIDELREKIHAVELENSQAMANVAVLENDISHLEESILQIEEQIEQSKSSKYFIETELEKRRSDLENIALEKETFSGEIEKSEQDFADIQLESEQFDKSFLDDNNKLNALYLKKSEYSFKLEAAKNSSFDAQESLNSALLELEEFEEKSKFTMSERRKLNESKDKVSEQKTEHQNRLSGFAKLLESKLAKLKSVEQSFNQNDIKLRETVQKLGLLRDLENSMEGFAYSVKNVMKASNQGRISGICGSIAQLITVDSMYTVAIETALGGALQNVVVENEDTAKRCMRFLKESNSGRATFLPITSVRGQTLNNAPQGQDGFIAIASELVKFDSKYSGVINYLLGRICIVENIDLATVIAKKCGYKFRIVTLDGQVINAGGSFTGGSVSNKTGILTRKNEIETLEQNKIKAELQLDTLKTSKESLSQETAKLSADTEGVKEQIEILSKEEFRLEMEIKRVSEYVSQYDEKLDSLDVIIENCKSKLTASSDEIDKANELLSDTENQIKNSEEKIQTSQNELAEMKKMREEMSANLSDLRIKLIELNKDEQACRLSIEQLSSTLENNSDDGGKLTEKIISHKKTISEKRVQIEKVKSSTDDSSSVVLEIENKISVAQREHNEFDSKANKLRQEQKIKMDEKETLSNEVNRVAERQKSCTADFDKLVAQLWDNYELTRSEAEEQSEQLEDIQSANRRLIELKTKIKNLGHVNLGAIEEYSEVSERYEFMKHQFEDVMKSKHELNELIENLTDNMKSMFVESFDKINSNFKSIFVELFGGGSGELVLTDLNNVLECGIDIKVQPPGKLIKKLSLLSGGEQSFVAICIYFSILKIRPSPFCLLDEIEAALDDVNVTKYAQYLHNFTDTTQFITVTHRRGTMEEADVLYGVTMQEDGISKLLKMSMEDTSQIKFE